MLLTNLRNAVKNSADILKSTTATRTRSNSNASTHGNLSTFENELDIVTERAFDEYWRRKIRNIVDMESLSTLLRALLTAISAEEDQMIGSKSRSFASNLFRSPNAKFSHGLLFVRDWTLEKLPSLLEDYHQQNAELDQKNYLSEIMLPFGQAKHACALKKDAIPVPFRALFLKCNLLDMLVSKIADLHHEERQKGALVKYAGFGNVTQENGFANQETMTLPEMFATILGKSFCKTFASNNVLADIISNCLFTWDFVSIQDDNNREDVLPPQVLLAELIQLASSSWPSVVIAAHLPRLKPERDLIAIQVAIRDEPTDELQRSKSANDEGVSLLGGLLDLGEGVVSPACRADSACGGSESNYFRQRSQSPSLKLSAASAFTTFSPGAAESCSQAYRKVEEQKTKVDLAQQLLNVLVVIRWLTEMEKVVREKDEVRLSIMLERWDSKLENNLAKWFVGGENEEGVENEQSPTSSGSKSPPSSPSALKSPSSPSGSKSPSSLSGSKSPFSSGHDSRVRNLYQAAECLTEQRIDDANRRKQSLSVFRKDLEARLEELEQKIAIVKREIQAVTKEEMALASQICDAVERLDEVQNRKDIALNEMQKRREDCEKAFSDLQCLRSVTKDSTPSSSEQRGVGVLTTQSRPYEVEIQETFNKITEELAPLLLEAERHLLESCCDVLRSGDPAATIKESSRSSPSPAEVDRGTGFHLKLKPAVTKAARECNWLYEQVNEARDVLEECSIPVKYNRAGSSFFAEPTPSTAVVSEEAASNDEAVTPRTVVAGQSASTMTPCSKFLCEFKRCKAVVATNHELIYYYSSQPQ